MVGNLDLMIGGVVHGACIAVLGGRGEELRAGHGRGHDLGLLGQDGVDGHAGVGCALLELWGTEVLTDEVLGVGGV